jgi:hypothetical protein
MLLYPARLGLATDRVLWDYGSIWI